MIKKITKTSILILATILISNCDNKSSNVVTKNPIPSETPKSEIKEVPSSTPSSSIDTKPDETTVTNSEIQVVFDSPLKQQNKQINSSYENQTRAPYTRTKTEVKAEIITNKLNLPWGIAFLDKDKMIVTEKVGNMRIVTMDGKVSDPIKGVPFVHFDKTAGLLDLALDPDFKKSRLVFFAFVKEYVKNDTATVVARGRLSEDEKELEDVKIIYESNKYFENQNYGCRLVFDKEGYLFASFGDRLTDESRVNAQKLSSSLGKVIRINKDGSIPKSNPFVDVTNAKPEIWALGVRNPQGLTINPNDGTLWESEHGPRGGDEINLIQPRLNYGWPVISYGLEYSGQLINGGATSQKGLEQPVYYWNPSIAPSGMSFYTGNSIPEWKNNLFVAILKGKHISRLKIIGNKVMSEEQLLQAENQRFRHIIQGPDEALYAITDQDEGRIYRISKK